MNSIFDAFHISNWKKLSQDQRFEALQTLEKHYATLQGRDPLKLDATEDEVYGYYYQGKIYLNRNSVLGDEDCYQAVNTVLHEGRHAFQTHAIIQSSMGQELSLSVSQYELFNWRMNKLGGYLRKKPDYWLQPIEKDANQYTLSETKKIYDQLRSRFGENLGYDKYEKDWNLHYENSAMRLKSKYGENYLLIIENKVYRKRNLRIEVEKAFSKESGRLLNKEIESFIHQTYPEPMNVKDFEAYLHQYLQDQGYKNIDQYLNEQKSKNQGTPKYYEEFILHNKIDTNPISLQIKMFEKMEQIHNKLSQQRKRIDPLGGKEMNKKLNEQLQTFNQKVQSEFQKQYPDVQLKPFHLSTSKIAIEVMKHNCQFGQKLDLDQGRELGFKQVELNKLVDKGNKLEMEL
ncbi:hypothetical protein [Hazenella coriacea]|uniref:Uncharacterized protein n=1 Tax=Hazenella coriacea TaxID=1179467 RepID=A0A4R3L3Z8_9BACL|nr:hypothetical protein [Hazenella coriacea]TCS93668.1 hypothetical protein EDD58_106101 [Hazenella coriacea]